MSSHDDLSRNRAEKEDSSGAIPCVVTAIQLSDEPTVTVRPQVTIPYDTFDGEQETDLPLEIEGVPYVYGSSNSFAIFVPPEVGMQGFLVITDTEVGEVQSGEAQISRRKTRSSGYFIPSGNLTGRPFKGSANWAEIRSKSCRVAVSEDTVHLEANSASLVLADASFDILAGDVSLVAALKQMSNHIAALEDLVHPNGFTHGGKKDRLVDTLNAATPPTRDEHGVR